ncbi:MAG TPA: Asp-tRNA(Asn)/Glu-tRNA(Gln) amidotransferase subunit GatC [Clostridia bacterium]|jgi:aspartyl-tRNA(Asn)/glutamyl-tRNA(Gln) amidotransferase subunit C
MITAEELLKISKLSRLTLSDEDVQEYLEDFNSILSTIETLNEVDTEGVEPTYSMMVNFEDLREDIDKPSTDRDKILQNAPETEDGAFRVPTVVE